METKKHEHFCEICFLEGGFRGTRPPLRRKSEKMSGTSRFATAVTVKLVAEPCFIFWGTLNRGSETPISVVFGDCDVVQKR